MAEVVALDLDGGPGFVEALRRVWDAGDAALPLDHRAPRQWRDTVLDALHPTAVVEADGVRRSLAGGSRTEEGDVLVIATSGTTGRPKGVVLTSEAIEHATYSSLTLLGVDSDARWLACLPLSHIGGFSVVARALISGVGLEVHSGFDAAAVERAARAGATHVSLVPTALSRIDATLFHTILLGGSQIPPQRPPNTVATYGMSESCGGVVYDGLALNGVGVRVGDDGEIELRGPTMLRCYRDGTDPLDAEGWYRTGDLGSIDPSGHLQVHGRADELIVTGAEKVWPEPVERIIASMPAVREVAVVGRADDEWGQRVTAIVVPTDPADLPDLEEVRRAVKAELPAFCAPKALEFASALPRTELGKLRRSALGG